MLLYVYVFLLNEKEVYIYAPSEKAARKKFKRWFNADAGDLVRREHF